MQPCEKNWNYAEEKQTGKGRGLFGLPLSWMCLKLFFKLGLWCTQTTVFLDLTSMCAEQLNYNILQWGSSFQSDNVDNIYIYKHIYGTHHWQILWSNYRKLARVGFETTTTELRSDYQAMSSTRTQSQLCTATTIYKCLCFLLNTQLKEKVKLFPIFIFPQNSTNPSKTDNDCYCISVLMFGKSRNF